MFLILGTGYPTEYLQPLLLYRILDRVPRIRRDYFCLHILLRLSCSSDSCVSKRIIGAFMASSSPVSLCCALNEVRLESAIVICQYYLYSKPINGPPCWQGNYPCPKIARMYLIEMPGAGFRLSLPSTVFSFVLRNYEP
jgi:hypothetical protein